MSTATVIVRRIESRTPTTKTERSNMNNVVKITISPPSGISVLSYKYCRATRYEPHNIAIIVGGTGIPNQSIIIINKPDEGITKYSRRK